VKIIDQYRFYCIPDEDYDGMLHYKYVSKEKMLQKLKTFITYWKTGDKLEKKKHIANCLKIESILKSSGSRS